MSAVGPNRVDILTPCEAVNYRKGTSPRWFRTITYTSTSTGTTQAIDQGFFTDPRKGNAQSRRSTASRGSRLSSSLTSTARRRSPDGNGAVGTAPQVRSHTSHERTPISIGASLPRHFTRRIILAPPPDIILRQPARASPSTCGYAKGPTKSGQETPISTTPELAVSRSMVLEWGKIFEDDGAGRVPTFEAQVLVDVCCRSQR